METSPLLHRLQDMQKSYHLLAAPSSSEGTVAGVTDCRNPSDNWHSISCYLKDNP